MKFPKYFLVIALTLLAFPVIAHSECKLSGPEYDKKGNLISVKVECGSNVIGYVETFSPSHDHIYHGTCMLPYKISTEAYDSVQQAASWVEKYCKKPFN